MMRDKGMHFQGLDVLGVAVAGSLAVSPSWYEHAMAFVPAPTAFYAICGSVFLIVKTLDMMGLLPRFGQRKDKD